MLITIGWAYVIYLQLTDASKNDKEITVFSIVLGLLGAIFATDIIFIILNMIITAYWVNRYLHIR